MPTEWYYESMDDVVGPLSAQELLDRVRAGDIVPNTRIRKDDSQWVEASTVNGLFDAAEQRSVRNVCPYCGHGIGEPPTTCGRCARKISLSFHPDQANNASAGERKAPEPELSPEELRRIKDRRDVIRYALLIVGWVGLLLAAPWLLAKARSGELGFDGDMAFVSVIGVMVVIAITYYVMTQVS